MKKINIYVLVCSYFFSCNNLRVHETKYGLKNVVNSPVLGKIIINECFEKQFKDEEITGGTKIVNTAKGNFYKYTMISDTEFVFSCGREKKEVYLHKYNCNLFEKLPQLVYEDYGVLIFNTKSGSDTWSDDFVNIQNETVSNGQSYFIDTLHWRYVDILTNKKDVFFLIHHIKEDYVDTLKSNYGKFRYDGDPYLHIKNVILTDTILYYSVETERKAIIKDSLNL